MNCWTCHKPDSRCTCAGGRSAGTRYRPYNQRAGTSSNARDGEAGELVAALEEMQNVVQRNLDLLAEAQRQINGINAGDRAERRSHSGRVIRAGPGANLPVIDLDDSDDDDFELSEASEMSEATDGEDVISDNENDDDLADDSVYDLEDSFIDDAGVDDMDDEEDSDMEQFNGEMTLVDVEEEQAEFDDLVRRYLHARTGRVAQVLRDPSPPRLPTPDDSVIRSDMFGACTICFEDSPYDPVGCIICQQLIGCRRCIMQWAGQRNNDPTNSNHRKCPLCRHEWDPHGEVEVASMFDLKEMD